VKPVKRVKAALTKMIGLSCARASVTTIAIWEAATAAAIGSANGAASVIG
jgi:hypothetical protein